MLKLIVGVKGTGKTKTLIQMANDAVDTAKGNVVFIEKGDKLMYDIKYRVRLIDTDRYSIMNAESLYGFVAGIIAGDNDLTHLFIDSALKICGNNIKEFEKFVLEAKKLADNYKFECIMTSSVSAEALPASLVNFV